MSRPARILFQSRNRRGLGHLMRAVNLARELRRLDPGVEIVIHARNASAHAFGEAHARCIVEDPGDPATAWDAVADDIAPDVVVYDTMLPDDPELEPAAARVYVMRKCKPELQHAIFAHPFLETVAAAIIPHAPDDFGYELPAAVARRCTFTGPIVRSPDPAAYDALTRRHGLTPGALTIVSTAGGGGFEATAGPFFDAVWAAHARIAERVPHLRHVVVLGPHREGMPDPLPGMSVVRSEPELATLFGLAGLVVAEGGYNSVNEIRLAKAPAVFVPGARRYDDQHERVDELAARGLAAVATGAPEEVASAIAAIACDDRARRAMREAYASDDLDAGNERAARVILRVARSAHETVVAGVTS